MTTNPSTIIVTGAAGFIGSCMAGYLNAQGYHHLILVDDFGVEYMGIEHFDYLLNLLKKFHGVQFNIAGDKLAGISIQWDYAGKRCQLSMPG